MQMLHTYPYTGLAEMISAGSGPNLKGLRSIKVGRVLLYAIKRIPDVRLLVELLGEISEISENFQECINFIS
jgi:hypothetical protein